MKTKDFIFAGLLVAGAFLCLGADDAKPPAGAKLVTETYVVRQGDTLDAIAWQYMEKNTYGQRDVREFREGIIEGNWDLFSKQGRSVIHPGDALKITYWEKGEGQ